MTACFFMSNANAQDCMGGELCGGKSPFILMNGENVTVSLNLHSNSTISNNVHSIELRFFDKNTNQTIPHVSFFLNTTKDNKVLMHDLFYTHTGSMVLTFSTSTDIGKWTVHGTSEPEWGGWMSKNDTVPITSSIFTEEGIYHIRLEILALVYPEIFDQNHSPTFDSWWSVDSQGNILRYDNNTIENSLKLGNRPVMDKILSPLKQFKSGTAANDIICKPDMQLLIQNREKIPICVKLDSVSNLLNRNWSYPSNCKYVRNPFTAGVEGMVMIEKNASDPSSGKSYFPRNSTVIIGWNNTVSWENLDDYLSSSVTSDQNLFDSGPIKPGADWQYDFECAGNYGYHSEPHPWMKGWIRVLPPSG